MLKKIFFSLLLTCGVYGESYSIEFLIEIASEKAVISNNAINTRTELFHEYVRNSCSDTDRACIDKAMARAVRVTNTTELERAAVAYTNRLVKAYERNPIKLTERQKYRITETCAKYIGFSSSTKLYKALH